MKHNTKFPKYCPCAVKVDEYHYRNERGIVIGTKQRFAIDAEAHGKPKTFAWKKSSKQPDFYGIPEMAKEMENGEDAVLWLVGGEKDKDNLSKELAKGDHGFVGTAISLTHGEKSFSLDVAEIYFGDYQGKIQIILDKDEPGWDAAAGIYSTFNRAGLDQSQIYVWRADGNDEVKDVSDHLDKGWSLEFLRPVEPEELALPVDGPEMDLAGVIAPGYALVRDRLRARPESQPKTVGELEYFRCPLPDHEDKDPSFRVSAGESRRSNGVDYPSRVLLICSCVKGAAGSPARRDWEKAVLKSLDLTWADVDNANSRKTNEKPRKLGLTRASEIEIKPVRWMWNSEEGGLLPLGEISLTAGHGGIGKSTFHTWLIAKLSTGTLKGQYFGEPRPSFIASAEDSWAHTIVPRLVAHGADLDMVFRIDVKTEKDEDMELSLPDDIDGLTKLMVSEGAVFLSVDPVMSFLSAKVDSHRDAEVRSAIGRLKGVAEEINGVVLLNTHFRKSAGGENPAQMVMGSAAFNNVVRGAFGFAHDRKTDSYILSVIKNNLSPVQSSWEYVIASETIQTPSGPTEVGRFELLGLSEKGVADVFESAAKEGTPPAVAEAVAWLQSYLLEKGPTPYAELLPKAKADSHSETSLKRASYELKVVKKRAGFGEGSTWGLPDEGEGVGNGG